MGALDTHEGENMDLEWLLTRSVSEVIVRDELLARLRSGRPLRLKQGFDPSKPNLHVGHSIGLRKLRHLQDLGHQVVLIVGDWTAQIGDPSGRDESRNMLTLAEVHANAETYMQQFFSVVDRARTEVRWQTEWFGKFKLEDVFNLTSRFTLAQMMAHETFRLRWERGTALSIMELMYPMLQAYDSVAIHADVEFGGTDQKFNILAGRELQTSLGMPPQDVFLVPLLPGTDGRKMSKSFGNTIDFTDSPTEMYGKAMSISDAMLPTYFELATEIPDAEVARILSDLKAGALHPRDAKMRLAREIVGMFYPPTETEKAEGEFVRVVQRKEQPEEMQDYPNHKLGLQQEFVEWEISPSGSAARRLIEQGGVKIDGQRIDDPSFVMPDGEHVVQAGKRRYFRVKDQ
jgi:tyrosyl-tRNA synthetase